ncbi:MAG TPA: hypothetical protein DDY58_06590, partial [Terrisporobacter glycolicus]
MELTNYWWLLIWIFIGGGIFAIALPKKQEVILGQNVVRWNIVPAVVVMLPYAIWAGFRGNFVDTNAYRKMFFEAPSSLKGIVDYVAVSTKDK